jgi:hypothetical protein
LRVSAGAVRWGMALRSWHLSLVLSFVVLPSILGGCLSCDEALSDIAVTEPCGCFEDRDCAGGACLVAADGCGQCVAAGCFDDSVCADVDRCDVERGICVPRVFCAATDSDVCTDPERCVQTRDDATCASPAAAAACEAFPASVHLVDGVTGRLDVWGTSEARYGAWNDIALTPAAGARFVGLSGSSGKRSIALAGVCADARCVVDVAAADPEACHVEGVALPALAPDTLRVRVMGHGGSSLAGATVRALWDDGTDEIVAADGDGVAPFDAAAKVLEAVVVSAPGQRSVALWQPTALDLEVALAPLPTDVVFGTSGTVRDGVRRSAGDVRVGLAGTSFGDLVDGLSATTLFGRPVALPALTAMPGVGTLRLGSAFVFRLGQSELRPTFTALSDGDGPRAQWQLAAELNLSQLAPVLEAADVDGEGGSAAAASTALLKLMADETSHGYAREAVLGADLAPRVGNEPLFPNSGELSTQTFSSAFVDVTLPDLPADAASRAAPLSAVFVAVVVDLPLRGLVPLGFQLVSIVDGALVDDDGLAGPPARVFFAPPHDGLEGAPLRVVALAYANAELDAGHLTVLRSSTPYAAGAVTLPAYLPPPVVTQSDGRAQVALDDEESADTWVRLRSADHGLDVWARPGDDVDLARLLDRPVLDDEAVEATALSWPGSFEAGRGEAAFGLRRVTRATGAAAGD